jgi:hypothetical protein
LAGECSTRDALDVVCNASAVQCVSIACVPEQGGCVALPNASHCTAHQGDTCFTPLCDVYAGCVYANRSCSDNNLCTFGDYCRNSTCYPGQLQLCANESITDQCVVTLCNRTSGQCMLEPHPTLGNACVPPNPTCTLPGTIVCSNALQLTCMPNASDTACAQHMRCNVTADCRNASFCSSVTCNVTSHTCVYTQRNDSAIVCADANACTYDYCNLATDQCVHDTLLQTGLPCTNANQCIQNSICFLGTCSFGTPVTCASNLSNGCRTSTCNPLVGCINTIHVNLSCATPGASGGCVARGRCNATAACVGEHPDNALCPPCTCRTAQCLPNGTCAYTDLPANTPCAPTTNISCQSGGLCAGHNPATCVPVLNDTLCDDGNPCSRDQCDLFAEACVHTPATSTTTCELPCYYLSECSNTNLSCVGLLPVDCSDTDDDDNLCTTRTCSSGFTCTNVTSVTCPPNATCDPLTGLCVFDNECVGKRVGELCQGGNGYCYLGTCYPCPNANSNDLIATLVFERLSHDILRLQHCNRSASIDPRVWTRLHAASFYTARNMTTCAQLLHTVLYSMANVTALLDAALAAAAPPCPNISSVRVWPSSLYFGWLVHEDVHESGSDYDYNDFTLGVRITHAYSSTRLLRSLVEFYPVSRGSFYSHEFRLLPLDPALAESAGLANWTYRRFFASNGSLAAAPATANAPAQTLLLVANTAATIGVQGTSLPLSQRITNTINTRPCFTPYDFFHLESAALNNAAAALMRLPEPCTGKNGTYFPLRLRRLSSSSPLRDTFPARFNQSNDRVLVNTSALSLPSFFVRNPRFRFTTEGTALRTLCPLFANCTTLCATQGGQGGSPQSACAPLCCSGHWEFACAFSNTALARQCN